MHERLRRNVVRPQHRSTASGTGVSTARVSTASALTPVSARLALTECCAITISMIAPIRRATTGGICTDQVNGFSCACAPGYGGTDCSTCANGYQDNDHNNTCEQQCSNSYCSNNGACSDASGTPTCTCTRATPAATCNGCDSSSQDNDHNGTCSAQCTATRARATARAPTHRARLHAPAIRATTAPIVLAAPRAIRTTITTALASSSVLTTTVRATARARMRRARRPARVTPATVVRRAARARVAIKTMVAGRACRTARRPSRHTPSTVTTARVMTVAARWFATAVRDTGTYCDVCPVGTINDDGDARSCSHIASASAGAEYSCGITDSQALFCWGDNTEGQSGNDGNVTDPPEP